MNSRDAAYDEEELIRRAIEESKEDTKSLPDDSSVRRGKRSRSASEVCVLLISIPHLRFERIANGGSPEIDPVQSVSEPLRLLQLLFRVTYHPNLHPMTSPKPESQP